MTTVRWFKKASGRWVLKSDDGQVWAAVAPYRSEHACKNQFRGTALGVERTRYFIEKFGGLYWTTGIGVAAAKRNIVRWMARHVHDDFQVAAA